jgi:WD40 repeat protein/transcriptional regulator with XRE-family HTH domain
MLYSLLAYSPIVCDLKMSKRKDKCQMKQNIIWYEMLAKERNQRGWSQKDVADKIGSTPKTVSRWENCQVFPGPFHRQRLAALFGKSVEELGLLPKDDALPVNQPVVQARPQEDWGEAPDVGRFYGRSQEIDTLKRWIIDEHCRLIALLGMGGLGKTSLAIVAAKKIQALKPFEYVYWRSLQNAPSVESLLTNCLQMLFKQRPVELPNSLDEQISLLIPCLQQHRCLLILDNVESILQAGEIAGRYLESHKGYGSLFQRLGEAQIDNSCLILTSREKPREIARLDGTDSPVRSLRLAGIEQGSGRKLLRDEGLLGSEELQTKLVACYEGNPLALKLVSELIREVFGGEIAAFLEENESVFDDISDLLEQQFRRLSAIEREILYWLAIERMEVSLETLQADMRHLIDRKTLRDALKSLRKRSFIERNSDHHFLLQPVIMEYVTGRFVETIAEEIDTEALMLLGSHALMKARTVDYVRQSQRRFILEPLNKKLQLKFGRTGSEKKLKHLLATLKTLDALQDSYAAGNLLNLLIQSGANLRGLDLAHLTLRQAYLQGVSLPQVNFSDADLADCTFTDTFSSILCVAVSPDGRLLAGGTCTDEVRTWAADNATSLATCLGHTDEIRSVAFSPDGRMLASGGEDHTVRLWDSATGHSLKVMQGHTNWVLSVAFSPDEHTLASTSLDQSVRLWDVSTGACIRELHGHTDWVRAVAFRPDGQMLASCGNDQSIRFWDTHTGACIRELQLTTGWVRIVAFRPDGKLLASAGEDGIVRFWNVETGECLQALQGHIQRIRMLVWTPDGAMLISGSDDQTIRLWDANTGECLKVLQGHTNRVWSVAFVPASKTIVSASEDDTLRFWDLHSGQCTRVLQGQTSLIKAAVFSPDGRTLVSGSEDQLVRLWDSASGQCIKTLKHHNNRVRCVAFSPDGNTFASGSEDETIALWGAQKTQVRKILRGHTSLVRSVAFNTDGSLLASGSYDQTIRIWRVETGQCLRTMNGSSLIWSVAFSPDGQILASGGDDRTVRLWSTDTGVPLKILKGHTDKIWSVAFHPNGTKLASSSDDQTVRIWDTSTGECVRVLQGHTSWVRSVAFSIDGSLIASSSQDQTVRLWNAASGQCLSILRGHESCVWSVAFSPIDSTLASASDDGSIRIWDIQTGTCLKTLRSERLYERLNIAHVRGLTDSQKTSLKRLGALEHEAEHKM